MYALCMCVCCFAGVGLATWGIVLAVTNTCMGDCGWNQDTVQSRERKRNMGMYIILGSILPCVIAWAWACCLGKLSHDVCVQCCHTCHGISRSNTSRRKSVAKRHADAERAAPTRSSRPPKLDTVNTGQGKYGDRMCVEDGDTPPPNPSSTVTVAVNVAAAAAAPTSL
jgi:hypothetical protein